MNHTTVFPAVLLLLVLSVMGRTLSAAESCDAVYGQGVNSLTVATGSPGELGLLEALSKAFSKRHNTAVRWKKAGSGEALMLLKERKVDVVLVHAPETERQAVAEGWAVGRTLIGSNEFYIVGPTDDPARVSEASTAADAYRRIAKAKARFLSRGDNSGTQKKETAIWRQAGLAPSGDWYVATKEFMRAALERADKARAYFMTDSSTWITARADLPNLKVLFRGDAALVNVYHALRCPEETAQSNPYAAKFIGFLRSEEAQEIVRDFGKERYGESLYRDAKYAKAFDD
jgi:tungstate transport system substrate-binding protein